MGKREFDRGGFHAWQGGQRDRGSINHQQEESKHLLHQPRPVIPHFQPKRNSPFLSLTTGPLHPAWELRAPLTLHLPLLQLQGANGSWEAEPANCSPPFQSPGKWGDGWQRLSQQEGHIVLQVPGDTGVLQGGAPEPTSWRGLHLGGPHIRKPQVQMKGHKTSSLSLTCHPPNMAQFSQDDFTFKKYFFFSPHVFIMKGFKCSGKLLE